MKNKIDYCILEILKQINCILFNTITMSDALEKVTSILALTQEEKISTISYLKIIKY